MADKKKTPKQIAASLYKQGVTVETYADIVVRRKERMKKWKELNLAPLIAKEQELIDNGEKTLGYLKAFHGIMDMVSRDMNNEDKSSN